MCTRLDRLIGNFEEIYSQVPSFPGKDETSSRFKEAVVRIGENVADHLDFRRSKFMSLAQNALVLTLGIRSPPSAWYSRQRSKIHHINMGDVITPKGHHQTKRGTLALAGTVASIMPLHHLWPLILSKPVIPTLNGWLEKLSGWFTRDSSSSVKEKELEREVCDVFRTMKKSPPRKPINITDPTIWTLTGQLLSAWVKSTSTTQALRLSR